eukprot:1051295-Rhodomonas_salina.1
MDDDPSDACLVCMLDDATAPAMSRQLPILREPDDARRTKNKTQLTTAMQIHARSARPTQPTSPTAARRLARKGSVLRSLGAERPQSSRRTRQRSVAAHNSQTRKHCKPDSAQMMLWFTLRFTLRVAAGWVLALKEASTQLVKTLHANRQRKLAVRTPRSFSSCS